MHEPDDERQPEDRVELVDVAERREHAVEQGAFGAREQPRHRSVVAGRHRGDAQQQAQGEPQPLGQLTPEQPGDAGRDDQHGVEDHGGREEESRPRRPARAVDTAEVGHPVGGATEHLDGRRHRRRDRGVLDVVEERRAVPAEEEQRPDPPGRREHHRRDPPPQQAPAPGSPPAGQEPEAGGRQDREDGRGVDRPHAQDDEPGARGRLADGALARAGDERHEHPGRQAVGQGLDRDRPQRRQDPWRQGEGQPAQQAAEGVADAEPLQQRHDAEEGEAEQQAPPQPLDHPGRQPDEMTEPEERPHGEQVSVALVLGEPEVAAGVPQVEGAGQEPEGVDRQVELGVADQLRGSLLQGQRDETGADREQAQPLGGAPRWSRRRHEGVDGRAATCTSLVQGRAGRHVCLSPCHRHAGSHHDRPGGRRRPMLTTAPA